MVSCKILFILPMLLTFGLSSASSLPTCFISTPFVGEWIQPGLADSITINNTSCSLKGICIASVGHQDVKNKFIFYNEQTRCKRCVLFISRHPNALQYRESDCFDADEDNTRICGSITPDTVLYTLFRENAESISCPFEQSWYFDTSRQITKACQPKAFQHCSSSNTFEISYNDRCQTNRNFRATCFARFTDGNINYIIARSNDRKRFVCFSYSKAISDEQLALSNEVHLSTDDTCRDLLTRESAIVLNVARGLSHHRQSEPKIQLPDWTHGKWLTVGTNHMNTNTIYINSTQIIIKIQSDLTVMHDLKLIRVIKSSPQHENSIRLKAKSFEECSSILYCIQLTFRSPSVIDFSMGFNEHKCQDSHLHYTLFKPITTSNISCPQMGIYKSSNTYRPLIPVSTCSIGLWTLSIGCEISNRRELTFSSTCRHETVPDVQVITSIKGICLASWRTDHRFQRTIIFYEQTRAFCLIQPLKSMTASWIVSDSSCTNIALTSINVENSLRYSDNCENYKKSSALLTTNHSSIERISYSLFSFLLVLLLCKY